MSEKMDILDRQPFVDRLIEIVQMLADGKKGCMFTIDGQWGCGKSFILDMFENQLSLIQDPTALDDRYFIFHYNYNTKLFNCPSLNIHKKNRYLNRICFHQISFRKH